VFWGKGGKGRRTTQGKKISDLLTGRTSEFLHKKPYEEITCFPGGEREDKKPNDCKKIKRTKPSKDKREFVAPGGRKGTSSAS